MNLQIGENSFQLYAGEIEKVSFGNGYLVNSISNSFDYPYNNFGIDLKYKLGNDFLNFRIHYQKYRGNIK